MILIRCAPIRRTFILSLHREFNILRMDDKTIIKEVEVAMNYLDMAQSLLRKVLDRVENMPKLVCSPQLAPNKTFQNYIEGDSNKLARTVGLSIAERTGEITFNPLFVFGPSGCGKTHLISAIGLRYKEENPQKRVLYVSAHEFQIQFADSVRHNTTNEFINLYQSIDMLIVDDIQEWKNSPKTLESFFYIFNQMLCNDKQIILASDRPLVELKGMKSSILTRFASGLVAELEVPNEQLCIEILKAKCRHDNLTIPTDVIEFIAKTTKGSVCKLEGVANSLKAYSLAKNKDIDITMAESLIKTI